MRCAVPTGSEDGKRQVSDKVNKIADDILSLNMLEVSDLKNVLKEKLNLPDDMPMGMPMGMPMMQAAPAVASTADGSSEEEKKEEVKTDFEVKIDSFDKGQKIPLIKEVQAQIGIKLKEAKTLVESAPATLKAGLAKDEAEKLATMLRNVGAEISVV